MSRRRATAPAATDPRQALQELAINKRNLEPSRRKDLLTALGYGVRISPKHQGEVTDVHLLLAENFCSCNGTTPTKEVLQPTIESSKPDDEAFLAKLLGSFESDTAGGTDHPLKYLLARGTSRRTILHTILDPQNYEPPDTVKFDFDKAKPFIRFLVQIEPQLIELTDASGKSALFEVISPSTEAAGLDKPIKEKIIRYFCDEHGQGNLGGLNCQNAIRSLTTKAQLEEASSKSSHAIHMAIEAGILFPEAVIKKAEGHSHTRRKHSQTEVMPGGG